MILALPILVLPTPVGLADIFAPTVTGLAFGTVSMDVVILGAALAGGFIVWLLVGGWLAAVLEAEGIRIVALDPDVRALLAPAPPNGSRAAAPRRILAARLTALIPLAVVLALGSVRVVLVTYRELTSPLDVTTPIMLRVLRGSPEVVAAVLIAWVLGEIVGAIAARRIVLAGDGVMAALRGAVGTCLRHPLTTLVRFGLPAVVLLVVLVPSIVAAGSAWSAVDGALAGGADLPSTLVIVVLFVLLWLVGLLLTGVVCAWRAAVWTVAEVTRRRTFGGSSTADRGTGSPRDRLRRCDPVGPWPTRREVHHGDQDHRLRRMRRVRDLRTAVLPGLRCAARVRRAWSPSPRDA